MSGSHRRSRAPIGRIQLILRLSLVLAIALLSIPFLGAVAKAGEGTLPVEPAATTAADPAPDPAEEPAAEPAEEPAAEPAAEPAPEEASEPAATPATSTRTLTSTNQTRTTAATTTTAAAPTSSGCAATFDQSTQQVHNTGHNYGAVPESTWINGNLNNDGYAEGDYVPQRVKLTGLQAGATQTLTFRYDRQVSGKYAFDFVADLQMSGGTAAWDAAPGNPPMPPAGAVFVTISFTPTGSSAALYWEGHIASELDYLDLGLNLGAGSISGSNYHFFLESLSCGNVGGQTNQMKSAEVKAGQITVIKDAQPNSAQDFGFLIQAPNASNDTVLDDDSDPTRSNETHSRVAPGNTTVTETQVAGWTLASITCTETAIGQTGGTAITPVSVDLAAGKVTVAIADDKNVTCTFVNTRLARVVVDKVWRINGLAYSEADAKAAFPQLGLASSLSLTGPAPAGASTQPWGTPRGGYVEGAQPTIDETSSATNHLCGPVTGRVTSANGTAVTAVLPYTPTLQGGDNRYTITNTVDCRASLTLVKVVDNGPAVATGWTLSATPSELPALDGPSGATGASGPVSAGTAYVLSETGGDARYVQNGAWTCSPQGAVTTVDGTQRVVVEPGKSATCTVHNATAEVTLVKNVTNDDGGSATADQWTLHAGGHSGTSGQSFWVKPGETLALSESGGPSGYGAGPTSLTCSDAPGSQVTSVTPTAGANVTCTFVNDDQPAALALTKILTQGDSGSQTPASAFTLTATPQSIVGQATESGAGGFGSRPVKAGTYLLSESGPTGYTPGTWNCTGGTMGGSTGSQTVTIANGGSASCSITNTAIMPTLTLVKDKQAGDTGSSTPATAWTLTANGPTMIAGSTGSTGPTGVTGRPVPVGTYTLSESGPTAGWTASDWVCTGGATTGGTPAARTVTIGLGQNVICTITNTAKPAHLSLDKDARANGTGTMLGDSAWTLTYAGPAIAAGPGGVARAEVPIGNYTLTESGPTAGWTASAWTCTRTLPGGATTAHQVTTDPDGTGHVNVALGEDVSCSIVNTATKPGLTLLKKVDGNGTGAETYTPDTSWTLHAELVGNESPAVALSGTEGGPAVTGADVPVGTYALSESGGPGPWTKVGWTCTDATGAAVPVTDDRVKIALGMDVACEVTNRAVPSTWTVTKTNTPGSGTTVNEGDVITYTVTATKNAGGVDVLDAKVTDDLSDILPAKGTPVGSIVTTSGTAESVGTSIVWTIPRLGAVPQTLTYQIRVGSLDGVTLRNHATGDGAEECLKGDQDCTTTNPTPHYVLDKAVDFDDPDGDGKANPGQDLTYTLTVRNDTQHAIVGDVVVIDDLSDVLLDAAMASTSEELAAQGLALKGDEGDEYLEWTVPGPVAPGASVTAAYVVTIDDHAWGRSLRNVATPQDDEGDCGQCTTTTETPQVTTLVVKKVDMEDDNEAPAGLAGAEFALYRDLGTVGSLDDADVLVPPLDDPDGDGDTVTGADGLATWGELRPGSYLVVEVTAPPGYDLPDPDTMPVVISDPGSFVPGGEMATLLFRDIAQGQLTITKQQWEKSGDEWVVSDGVVAHGDLVKYTLHVETQGLKRFHDVTVRDYVPNRNPGDTTSTGAASLVAGSAVCVQVVCTVDVAEGLITWHLGNLEEGAVDLEFVARFPALPAKPTYDENDEFRTLLWNQAYLDWRQVTGRGEGGLLFQPGSAASNEVLLEAVVTQPEEPVEPPIVPEEPVTPPSNPALPALPVLPGTGAPEHLLRLALLGILAVAAGIALVGRKRRRGQVG